MSQDAAIRIVHTTGRNNCGGRCIIHAHVQDGRILKITTDTAEAAGDSVPLRACARGMNYHKTFLSEDRLTRPLLRTGARGSGNFREITWEEAIDRVAGEWIRIRDTYGPASRYVHYATGVSAAFRPDQLAKRLLALDGGFLDYYNSYSSPCIRNATELIYGTCDTGNSFEDLLNSSLILLFGHNPAETVFDSGSMFYLRKAREKGIPIIGIDPRQSDTLLQLGAEWIPIIPATDAALQDAMAFVILTEGLTDRTFLERCCIGFTGSTLPEGTDPKESVSSYLLGECDGIPKTPEWAEPITGIPAETIRSLAIRYATAKPAALLMGYGAQRHSYGEQGVRGGILLACMTGNVGIPGGNASGAGDWSRHRNPKFPMPDNPIRGTIPTYCYTEAILRGHEMTDLDGVRGLREGEALGSDIRMILSLAGNALVNQHGDINRTKEILRDPSKCEFIVVSDLFMTSSAKFADIVLPGVSFLESENLTMPWTFGDFIGCNNQVVEPVGEGRFEYEWLTEIADRLGLREAFTEGRSHSDWLRYMYEEVRTVEPELPDYEAFREAGIYRYRNNPPVIAFSAFREDPEAHPLPTETGRIELYSPKIARTAFREFFPAIPRYVPPIEGRQDPLHDRYPLQLIGWHTKRRCHSIHDNNPALERLDPQRLWIHPEDAEDRGLADGDRVIVYNDRGKIQVPVLRTARICRGVVALAQGAWYTPDESGVDQNGSINVLTSLRPTPYARGNAQHTNLVEVRKITAPRRGESE